MRTFAQRQKQPQKRVSLNLAWSNTTTPRLNHRADLVPHLQHRIGNQARQPMLQPGAEELEAGSAGTVLPRFGHDFSGPPATKGLQSKLAINKWQDKYEQEADRVAEKAMRMPAPTVRRTCTSCTEGGTTCPTCKKNGEEDGLVEGKATDFALTSRHFVPDNFLHSLSPCQPLDPAVRSFFERRFDRDLRNVRIHTDAQAAESARSINARAYTVGRSIVFGAGEFRPETHEGRLLLAHEITHIIQQGQASFKSGQQLQRKIGDGHDLQATRFISPSRNTILEAAFDEGDRVVIKKPDNGPHVKLLQESLLAMGYALPAFGADGDFGDETKAAILQFQRDAGAKDIDGIVGPETMALFDQHDPTRPRGVGPPQKTGPVPGPLPPPAQGCDDLYNGVTFTPTNKVAHGVSHAADFVLWHSHGRARGLNIDGIAPVQYAPSIEITAPSNAKAQEFEVGFVSNCLIDRRDYTFSNGVRLTSTVPTPIKDGKSLSTNDYDPVYTRASGVRSFTANGQRISLTFLDTPQDSARGRALNNPQCAGLPDGILTDATLQDHFRTWVVTRHKASGCTRGIHHIDWNTDWRATVAMTRGAPPTVTVVSDAINVTTPDGDGKPQFIQGGQVMNDLLATHRDCR
jgi:Domain of unknown function (DUF4157)/Putative peptidoglycan binding domain